MRVICKHALRYCDTPDCTGFQVQSVAKVSQLGNRQQRFALSAQE